MSWAVSQLASFEFLFLLVTYSNQIETLLPILPFDATLLLTVMSIPVGLWILVREGIHLRGLPSLVAGTLFLAWVVTTYAWTPSRIMAPKTVSYLVTFALWFLVVGTLIFAGNRERVLRLILLHVPLALLFSIYGLYIYLTYGSFRYSGIFVDVGRVYLSWGYMVSAGGAVAFTLAILARTGSRRQLTALVLWGLCLVFLLIAGGRGPLLANLAICLIPLLVKHPPQTRGHLLISHAQLAVLLLVVIVAGIVTYLVTTDQATSTLGRFAQLFAEVGAADGGSVVGYSNRLVYFQAAYDFWMQAPIFGHGTDSFSILLRGAEIRGSYPHNLILQIMCETGLVGLVLFLLFLGMSLRRLSLAQLRVDPLLLCALLVAVTALIAAMFSSDIAGNRRVFLLFGLLTLRPRRVPDLA